MMNGTLAALAASASMRSPPRAEKAGKAGRGDADGARVGPAEKGGALVAAVHVDAIARHQLVAAEGVLVAGDPVLVLEAALDEIVGDLRQAALGQLAQVVEVDGGIDVGRQGGIPPDRAWLRGILKPIPAISASARVGRAGLQWAKGTVWAGAGVGVAVKTRRFRSLHSHANLPFSTRAKRNSMLGTAFSPSASSKKWASLMIMRQDDAGNLRSGGLLV